MNEIQIRFENNQMLVSSLQVAKDFGKEHKTVLRDIKNLVAQNCAAKSLFYDSEYDNRGKKFPMYLMNRDGFTLLAMGFTGKDALEWKLKYINAFNDMEAKLNSPEFIMQRALEYSKQRCETLLLENRELKPKAQFADAVSTSENSCLVGELAKIIKANGYDIGQKRLFEWLRENGYLMRKGEAYNQPTQKSMDLGLMKIKKGVRQNPDGSSITTVTTKITGKGQIYFVNKFMKIKEEAKLICL